MKTRPARDLAILGAAILLASSTVGLGQPRIDLRAFMRKKLDHSQKVLEGLTLENYGTIAANAKALKELSEDAHWRVFPNVSYLRMSAEFRQICDELAEKAGDKNLDGATLAFVKLTMNCVNCHKLVRDDRLSFGEGRGRERPARPVVQ